MDSLNQEPVKTSDQFILRFLMNVPPAVASSFSDTQLAAIKAALSSGWSSHPVEIRRTISLFGRRFFFVVLGGVERRSIERIRADHAKRPLWTFANSLVIGGFVLMMVFSMIGTTFLLDATTDGAILQGLQVPNVITSK